MVEEEVDEGGDYHQDQKEKEHPPGIAPFWSDGRIADGAPHAGGGLIIYFA